MSVNYFPEADVSAVILSPGPKKRFNIVNASFLIYSDYISVYISEPYVFVVYIVTLLITKCKPKIRNFWIFFKKITKNKLERGDLEYKWFW